MINIKGARATSKTISATQARGVISFDDFCLIEYTPKKWMLQLLVNEGYAYRLLGGVYPEQRYMQYPTCYFVSKLILGSDDSIQNWTHLTAKGQARLHKLCKKYKRMDEIRMRSL